MLKLAALLARVRGSTWLVLVAKGVLACAALLVLAWIGRAATAGASPSSGDPGAPFASAAAPLPPVHVTLASGSGAGSEVAVDAGASPAAAAPARPASTARATVDAPVFLNEASVDELRRLPGVGPKRAEAILALRQRLGRFRRVEDLLRVKGVGRATLKKWRPLVRLDADRPASGGLPGDLDAGPSG